MQTLTEIRQKLLSGDYDKKLLELYFEPELVAVQRRRYEQALAEFENAFGEGEAFLYSAPGRTEIGGNHTDHQHGQVLAASIHLDAIAVVRPIPAPEIRLLSAGYPLLTTPLETAAASSEHPAKAAALPVFEADFGTTRSLIRGVCQGFLNHGFSIGGFEAYVTSDVLIGAGLSSSAAFETLLGTILSSLYNGGSVDAVTIAKIGQYAENVYFGKPCGLMDQMACSVGNLVHIDFADPEAPVVSRVEVDFDKSGYTLCITDTKGSHANLTPDYAAIPAEMKAAAKVLGKEYLGEVSLSDIYANLAKIREKAGDRAALRAIHFAEENRRVPLEADALRRQDMPAFLQLVNASGNSSYKYLQNVYSPQDVATQNVSLGLALSEHLLGGKGASRVHGGGFAGTMEAFVPNENVSEYRAGMDALFGKDACKVLHIRKCGGVSIL